MWKKWLLRNLDGFPLAPLRRVFHLITGVEPGEWREGVDPGATRAWEGPHEAGDAAQGGDGLWRQRWVHQQVRHQVPSLVDDWQIHAIASWCTLKTRSRVPVKKLLQHGVNYFLLFSLHHYSLLNNTPRIRQTILLRLICIIETQGGSSAKELFFITVTVISWHVLCFPNSKKLFWSFLVFWPVYHSKHWERTLL